MCGINGLIHLNTASRPDAMSMLQELRRTRDYMARRGPDGLGEWQADDGQVALGHRRLAIIDLSDAGLQPMCDFEGRYHIVFNGEIYNYQPLRRTLQAQGYPFRSTTDTEVLLALYAREGVKMFSRLRGMFTLALWDDVAKHLVLARDHYGIKPLYYHCDGDYLRFASQVKALEAAGVAKDVDPVGLVGFLLWGSVPEPHTIRAGIQALPAGHLLEVHQGRIGQPRPFDQLPVEELPETQHAADAILQAVAAHRIADVPVGVFLSAGVDSTLIAAAACQTTDRPITTLTLRFEEFIKTPYDEAPLAAAIARALGTQHQEYTVGRADFQHLWSDALHVMDQPSIDGFNTYVISRIAHEAGFKVVLSGLGGDELMGGYPSFKRIPRWLRWSRWGHRLPFLPSLWPHLARPLITRQPKLKNFFAYGRDVPGAYFLQRALYFPEELPGLIGPEMARQGLATYAPTQAMQHLLATYPQDDPQDLWHSVHRLESGQYMRNQLLRDADWASMAHSLELRVPLVDTWLRAQMQALAFQPVRTQGKAAVLHQLKVTLPQAFFQRPKTGFAIPVMNWLRNEPKLSGVQWGQDSRRLALIVLNEFNLLPMIESA